jgi:hypothetical protein
LAASLLGTRAHTGPVATTLGFKTTAEAVVALLCVATSRLRDAR